MQRRVTRSSRTVSSLHDSGTEEPSAPSPKKRIVEPVPVDPVKASIDRLLEKKSLKVSTKYVEDVEKMLKAKLDQILALMTIVSNHRAGLLPESEEYSLKMKEASASLEEFLLFKEDCAAYFSKRFPLAPSEGVDPNLAPPQFNKAEYASHALEEENRMLVTAQSVKRLGGRDLLPLLERRSPLTLPPGLAERLVNKISFSELVNEYVSQNSSSS